MSKLLLDERPLQVLPCLATAIGLNEAIALQQLHWVLQNPKMGKEVDGKKYVHMSYAEWRTGHFPFWSEATIQRTFAALEEMKLIESRNDLNQMQIDRTKWYWIDPQAIARLEASFESNSKITEHKEVIDGHSKMKDGHSNLQEPSSQDERTIPDTSPADTSLQKDNNNTRKARAKVKPRKKEKSTEELRLEKQEVANDPEFSSVFQAVDSAMGSMKPAECELLKDLWAEFHNYKAHQHAFEQTRTHASYFNLGYYESCLKRYAAHVPESVPKKRVPYFSGKYSDRRAQA